MDINRFTAALTARLEAAGADRRTASESAHAFVASMSEDDAAKIVPLADNDEMMNKITMSVMRHIEVSARASRAESRTDDDDEDDSIEEMLAHTSQNRITPPPGRPPRPQGRPAQNPAAPGRQSAMPQGRPVQMQPRGGAQMRPRQGTGQNRGTRPSGRTASKSHRGTGRPERRPIYKPDPNANYQKFYIILACSAPLWGFVLLLGAAAFVFAIGLLSLSIVTLIVGLFAGVAIGTIASLVGIIYGITQLFEYAPIGTYEIGLGIMIGGAVMFFGVLAYNVAVRLLPYLIKEVMVLLSFTIHKCVELYYYVKGRCADL